MFDTLLRGQLRQERWFDCSKTHFVYLDRKTNDLVDSKGFFPENRNDFHF